MDKNKKLEKIYMPCSKLHDFSVVNHGKLSLILIPCPKLSRNIMILLSLDQCWNPKT
jgi:hypothetical protein